MCLQHHGAAPRDTGVDDAHNARMRTLYATQPGTPEFPKTHKLSTRATEGRDPVNILKYMQSGKHSKTLADDDVAIHDAIRSACAEEC